VYSLIVVAVIGVCAVRVEAAGSDHVIPLKEQLIKLLASITMKMNHAIDEKFCREFFEDFKKQGKIEHVQPIIQADRIDDPALASFLAKCPTVKWIGAEADEPGYPLNTRVRTQSRNTVGTAHFRLYQVDIDNNKRNGREHVFYRDGFVPEPLPGEELSPVEELGRTLGVYMAVDFERCAVLGGVEVGQGGTREFPIYNGLLRYRGQSYIYNLYGYGKYRLNIEKFAEERNNFKIVCRYWQ
jgi:hypothetical protein